MSWTAHTGLGRGMQANGSEGTDDCWGQSSPSCSDGSLKVKSKAGDQRPRMFEPGFPCNSVALSCGKFWASVYPPLRSGVLIGSSYVPASSVVPRFVTSRWCCGFSTYRCVPGFDSCWKMKKNVIERVTSSASNGELVASAAGSRAGGRPRGPPELRNSAWPVTSQDLSPGSDFLSSSLTCGSAPRILKHHPRRISCLLPAT